MKSLLIPTLLFIAAIAINGATVAADTIPQTDARLGVPRTLDTHVIMPSYATQAQWEARANALRTQILVSAGLWPMPTRPPLNPRVFGKIERDGYSIEKVLIETMPGFFLGGNLYRPLGRMGPFPGIVSPHGHWARGRLEDSELGSIPARCLSLARLGFVVFAYDMIGYNDTKGLDHKFTGAPLWGISLQGLQLWNSIRAVDFIAGLRDVDAARLGCTGASGGGTQTFLLTAVDNRIKVSAPVNMISHTMQGGCLCENGPLLRIGTNNMEIGATMAPRPMLMISATGDWTKDTPTVEYPAVRSVYELYKAQGRLKQHQVDAPHNYNRQSREHVYAWMVRWLQQREAGETIAEREYPREKPEDLLALAPNERPVGELKSDALLTRLIADAQESLRNLAPKNRAGLQRFREIITPGYKACLGASLPDLANVLTDTGPVQAMQYGKRQSIVLSRRGLGDRVAGELYGPANQSRGAVLIIGAPDATGLNPIISELLQRQQLVLAIRPFARKPGDATYPDANFSVTYNLPPASEQAQDVLTALAYLHQRDKRWRPKVLALGVSGVSALAGQALDAQVGRVAVDCQNEDLNTDQAYQRLFFIPSVRRLGGLTTALALSAPRPVWLFNARGTLPMAKRTYEINGAGSLLKMENRNPPVAELAKWLMR